MKKFLNTLINTFIFLLILVGSLLVGWHFIQENVMLYLSQVEIIPEEFETNLIETEETAIFDWDAVIELDWQGLLPYVNYEVSPIGELIVPSVEIRLPILQGTSNVNVSLGAGTMEPDLVMGQGNFSLASHWHPNPRITFGSLDQIRAGDLIILRDADYLYIYETFIYDYIINPYRVDITDYVEGKIYVTLMTCTPGGRQRVMVRGEFIIQIPLSDLAAAEAMLAELEGLEAESVIDVIETLEYTEIPFPLVDITLAVGISLMLAALVVWISNRGFKRKNDKDSKVIKNDL